MGNSTTTAKPAKPYPDFPLFPHATKRWAKKIRGKLHYFGSWDDGHDAALDAYLRVKDYLHAGKVPPVELDGLTVHQLCNAFYEAKERQVEAGDIRRRTFDDYVDNCAAMLRAFGKNRLVSDLRADDFEQLQSTLAKGRNPNTLGNMIQRVRVAFNYAYQAELIDRPVRFGPTFKRPAKRIRRALRQAKGPRLFEVRHLRRLIKKANPQLQAMLLLGVNCGFGPEDCGRLPRSSSCQLHHGPRRQHDGG